MKFAFCVIHFYARILTPTQPSKNVEESASDEMAAKYCIGAAFSKKILLQFTIILVMFHCFVASYSTNIVKH